MQMKIGVENLNKIHVMKFYKDVNKTFKEY